MNGIKAFPLLVDNVFIDSDPTFCTYMLSHRPLSVGFLCAGSWSQHWLIYDRMSSQLDSSNDKRNGTKGSVSGFSQEVCGRQVHVEASPGHEENDLVQK